MVIVDELRVAVDGQPEQVVGAQTLSLPGGVAANGVHVRLIAVGRARTIWQLFDSRRTASQYIASSRTGSQYCWLPYSLVTRHNHLLFFITCLARGRHFTELLIRNVPLCYAIAQNTLEDWDAQPDKLQHLSFSFFDSANSASMENLLQRLDKRNNSRVCHGAWGFGASFTEKQIQ